MPRVPAAILAAALSAACAAAADAPPRPDTAAARVGLDGMWSKFTRALVAGDSGALAAVYTDSATFAETGVPTMRGRSAIVAGAASAFAQVRYLESQPRIEVTEVMGERVFQFGTYRDVVRPTGKGPLAVHGRFAAVAERDAGAWKISKLVVIRDSIVAQ